MENVNSDVCVCVCVCTLHVYTRPTFTMVVPRRRIQSDKKLRSAHPYHCNWLGGSTSAMASAPKLFSLSVGARPFAWSLASSQKFFIVAVVVVILCAQHSFSQTHWSRRLRRCCPQKKQKRNTWKRREEENQPTKIPTNECTEILVTCVLCTCLIYSKQEANKVVPIFRFATVLRLCSF